MILLEYSDRGCMRLGATRKHESRRLRKAGAVLTAAGNASANDRVLHRAFTRRRIIELLFENCVDCGKMAAIPQGAFAACKVHRNLERSVAISTMEEEKEKTGKENVYNGRPPLEGWELTPLKYNSKLMNSIWGLYNRYSVHNFKKNTDSDEGVSGMFAAVHEALFQSRSTAVSNSQIIAGRNSI